MCISQLFFCKQAIVFISDSLQSVICVDADMCTNCFWVKMTTHNEKNQHLYALFFACQRLQHLLLPCIDLNTYGTYFLLNFEKKNYLLWPIFYRWCWWMDTKDKKFRMSRSAFRSWWWIRCVTVCTQLLLNYPFCPSHRAESPEKQTPGGFGSVQREGPGVAGLSGLSSFIRALLFPASFCHPL